MERFAVFAASLTLWTVPALAQQPDCKLKQVNTIPLTMVDDGLRALVPVAINGTPEMFVLDTGGAGTQLSLDAIDTLKLVRRDGPVKLLSVGGGAATGSVKVGSFDLGRLRDRNTELLVSPFRFGGIPPVAGILAADYMAHYDLEFDFTNARLNYMSPEHCPGKVVYWPATAITDISMKFIDHHLRIDVLLDGKPFRAIIDTGAPRTTLQASEARSVFGLTETSPDVHMLGGADGEKRFEKTFDSLTFGGISIAHPHITVIPDLVGKHDANNDLVTGSRLHRVDDRDPDEATMLIGMNILTKLHFYVAFSEDKIYLTPAAPPALKP